MRAGEVAVVDDQGEAVGDELLVVDEGILVAPVRSLNVPSGAPHGPYRARVPGMLRALC